MTILLVGDVVMRLKIMDEDCHYNGRRLSLSASKRLHPTH